MKDAVYHIDAVRLAWHRLTDRGIKVGSLVTAAAGQRYYANLRARMVQTYKGAKIVSEEVLRPLFEAVPLFEAELKQQQMLLDNPALIDGVDDELANAVRLSGLQGGLMGAIVSMSEDLRDLKARVAEIEARLPPA